MLNFANPQALFLLAIPVGLALAFLFRKRKRNRLQLPFAGPLDLLRRESRRTRWIFRLLFVGNLAAASALIVAIARPIKSSTTVKKKSEGIDIVMVFDLSESMDATDFEPTRLVVAKEVMNNFIKRRPNDRIGLVTFGGDAVTKVPLTTDHDFLFSQIEEIKLRELKQGTAIGMGLANGISRLRSSQSRTKILILLTDGDSNVGAINPITAAHLAKQEGIKIYSIGIGKQDRVIVPIYAYDLYGRKTQLVAQIPSYINPELLKEISRVTGGIAYMARDPGALNNILMEVDKLEKSTIKMQPVHKTEENFATPALLAVLILAFTILSQETRFRRGHVGHAA